MYQRVFFSFLLASLLASASACASRTAAATQKTPAAFDPAASEPKALAAVDDMLTALGGADKWAAVKQLRWELKYRLNGELKAWSRHSWDIWNGRHRYEFAASDQLQSDEPVFTIAMYDLFDHEGKGVVSDSKKPNQRAGSADRDRVVKTAYEAWQRDAYQITMLYKLRDPGVILNYAGERKDFESFCKPSCLDIKVSFAPGVGTDTYHVYINSESKLPEIIEKVMGAGRMSIGLADWTEVGGLKFPQTQKNLGPDEVFSFEKITIDAPDDELYIPRVIG